MNRMQSRYKTYPLIMLVIICMPSCFIIKPVQITGYENTEIRSVSNLTDVYFDATIENPNNYPVKIKKLKCILYCNDSLLSSVTALEEANIMGKEVSRVPLSFETDSAFTRYLRKRIEDKSNQRLSGQCKMIISGTIITKKLGMQRKFIKKYTIED